MRARTSARALTRRINEQFLMFGLSGLFLFLATAIYLSWHNQFLDFLTVSISAPLLLLLIGSFSLRRISQSHDEIEGQLCGIADAPEKMSELRLIPSKSVLASGWNQLLTCVQQQQAWNGVERRLSEAMHTQQSHRWESMFHCLPDGVATCDENGLLMQVNVAFATIIGNDDTSRLIGKPLVQLIGNLLDGPSREKLDQVVLSNATQTLELFKTSNPADGVLRLTARATQDLDSSVKGSIWTIRDVTQLKLAERAREDFVFTATHELRTPLANIRAYSETLATATDIPIEQQNNFYNIINSEANRLSRFIDELLNISQMEAGAITIQKHELQLERILTEVFELQNPLALKKNLKFEHSISPKLPRICADKEKLAAALANLVGNAMKYTPENGRVHIRVESDEQRVFFHVEDSGFGIASDEIAKLGTKFYRSNDPRIQEQPGSGLGLTFVQEVARLHGGTLAITSELNQGSCFTLEIPLR